MSDDSTWRRIDGWRGARSLAMEWGSVALVLGLSTYMDAPLVYAAAVVLLGGLQHRLAALGHEAGHGTLFAGRFWNDAAADVLCFFPVLGTIRHYRRWHLAHHASPNHPDRDPDVLNLGPWLFRDRFPMAPRRLVWLVFLRGASAPVAFVRYGFTYLRMNTLGWGDGFRPASRDRLGYPGWLERLARVAFYGGLGLALWASGSRIALACAGLWAASLMTTFPYFLMLRDTFQHTNADAGLYTNTRVFRVHPALRWAVFPYGQDLHLPHHVSPAVPHYRLEALHRHLLATRDGYGREAVECRGVLWNRTGEATIAEALGRKD